MKKIVHPTQFLRLINNMLALTSQQNRLTTQPLTRATSAVSKRSLRANHSEKTVLTQSDAQIMIARMGNAKEWRRTLQGSTGRLSKRVSADGEMAGEKLML